MEKSKEVLIYFSTGIMKAYIPERNIQRFCEEMDKLGIEVDQVI